MKTKSKFAETAYDLRYFFICTIIAPILIFVLLNGGMVAITDLASHLLAGETGGRQTAFLAGYILILLTLVITLFGLVPIGALGLVAWESIIKKIIGERFVS